jgi:phosphotransferase system IIB component
MSEGKINPTPSRTLRIPVSEYDTNKYSYNYTLNGNVYFLSFDTIEDSMSAYTTFKNDNIPVKYHVYSLFIKFDESIEKQTLEQNIKNILSNNCNITYIRVDNKENTSSHTGKVVIDKLEDCKNLLSYKDDSSTRLRFYRFDPKKAIKKSNKPDGFVKVVNKKNNYNKSQSQYHSQSQSQYQKS